MASSQGRLGRMATRHRPRHPERGAELAEYMRQQGHLCKAPWLNNQVTSQQLSG